MSAHPLKQSLMRILQDPNWKAVQQVASELIINNNTKAILGETMDQIAIQAIERQSQNAGMKKLLNELSSIASGERDTE